MPSANVARHRVLLSSVKFLLEQGPNSTLSNSGFAQSHTFSKLINGIRQFHISSRSTSQRIAGTLPHELPVTSAYASSSQSRASNSGNLVFEHSRRSPCVLSQMNMVSTSNSFPGGSKLISPYQDGQVLNSAMSRNAYDMSLDYCRTICRSLRSQEPTAVNIVVKPFWSGAAGQSLKANPFVNHRMRKLSSFVASYSDEVASDVSLSENKQEKQQSNSSDSSDQKVVSDRTLKLQSGSCYLPHPDKEETGGEDAHFICDEQAIGVADGVGGWAEHGVDAGQYARELMSHSLNAIEEEPKGCINPLRVLEKAYASTRARGSSTACIIALTYQGIHAVNLGDSGFIVVRDGCTIFRSPVQQHDFNFTYQLESGNTSDLPSSAQVFEFPVESGDAIVAGTDGLFDNLYNNEITAVVVHAIRAGLGPQVTAQKIAALARQRAQDKNRQTPFSTAAQEAGFRYYGGKLDDITVVVSYITAFGT